MSRDNKETLGDALGMPVILTIFLFVVIAVVCFVLFNSCRPGEDIAGKILVGMMVSLIGTFLLIVVNYATL